MSREVGSGAGVGIVKKLVKSKFATVVTMALFRWRKASSYVGSSSEGRIVAKGKIVGARCSAGVVSLFSFFWLRRGGGGVEFPFNRCANFLETEKKKCRPFFSGSVESFLKPRRGESGARELGLFAHGIQTEEFVVFGHQAALCPRLARSRRNECLHRRLRKGFPQMEARSVKEHWVYLRQRNSYEHWDHLSGCKPRAHIVHFAASGCHFTPHLAQSVLGVSFAVTVSRLLRHC